MKFYLPIAWRGLLVLVGLCVVFFIVAVISALNAPVGYVSGRPLPHQLMIWRGITPAQLNEAEILCSGHFVSNTGQSHRTTTVDLTVDEWTGVSRLPSNDPNDPSSSSYTYKGVDRRLDTFVIDRYWKGAGPSEIQIAVFTNPPLIGDTSIYWKDKRLMLALKKDVTGSGGYQLADLMSSWLLLPDQALASPGTTVPERIVERAAVEALESYATYVAPAEPPNQHELEEDQSMMLERGLETLQAAGTNDSRTIEALKIIFLNNHLPLGGVWAHSTAFDELFKIDPAQACAFGLDLYKNGKLDDGERCQFIEALGKVDPIQACQLGAEVYAAGPPSARDRQAFRYSLALAIKPATFGLLDPKYIEQVLNGDHESEIAICDAFEQFATRDNDTRAVPWLGRFLTSKFPPIQYRAMGALRYVNMRHGGKPSDLATPLNPHNSIPQVGPYPQDIIGPYQAWVQAWIEQNPQDAIRE